MARIGVSNRILMVEQTLPIVDASCSCEPCVSRTTEMYDLPGQCLNCGAKFVVRSRKGDASPLWVTCPSCEVTEFSWHVR